MGLDFSHCEAHWTYSGFDEFRTLLSNALGIELEMMEGFGGTRPWDDITDPIKGLLDHSDCDGKLSPDQCRVIAPRLRELVSEWPDDDSDAGDHKINALMLADGMEEAARCNEPLEFC